MATQAKAGEVKWYMESLTQEDIQGKELVFMPLQGETIAIEHKDSNTIWVNCLCDKDIPEAITSQVTSCIQDLMRETKTCPVCIYKDFPAGTRSNDNA